MLFRSGITPEVFDQELERDQYLIINTSSADRHLSASVELFREIKKQVPQAKFKWAYGWGTFDTVHGEDAQVMDWKRDILKKMEETEGFEALGMISHEEVAKLYMSANVFLYPTEFAEIDCISLTKAQAAGAYPVSTDFAALGGKTKYGDFTHSDKTKDNWSPPYKFDFALEDPKKRAEMVRNAVKRLKTPLSEGKRQKMRDWAKEKYDWDKIAATWTNAFK